MSDYFDKYGSRTLGTSISKDKPELRENGTIEELYQAFKDRIIKEINQESLDGSILFTTHKD